MFRRKGSIVASHGFADPALAHGMLEAIGTGKQVSTTKLSYRNGDITAESEELEEILETEPTKLEPLHDPLLRMVRDIRQEKRLPPAPPQTPRVLKAEGVSLQQLCKELKLEPRIARQKLRKVNIGKPYQWTSADLPRIRSLLGQKN